MAQSDEQRIPGLYHMCDLQFLTDSGTDYRVSYAGQSRNGTPLFALYRRTLQQNDDAGVAQ